MIENDMQQSQDHLFDRLLDPSVDGDHRHPRVDVHRRANLFQGQVLLALELVDRHHIGQTRSSRK